MRVLMLSSNWPPAPGGGAETYAVRLTDELRKRGHDVGVVTLGIDGPDVVGMVDPRPHGLARHRGASRRARVRFHVADLWRSDVDDTIRRAIDAYAPDVVHSHVVAGMSVRALTVPRRVGVPHVHTLHDHWLRCLRTTGTNRAMGPCGPGCGVLAWMRGGTLRKAGPDVFVAISEAIASSHEQLSDQRVEVIHHPADVPPSPRARQVTPPVTFGFLGMLNPNKGVTTLLAAARQFGGPARFAVAGTGPLSHEVATAELPGLDDWGWVDGDRREDFFASIDCLVVPSIWPEPAGLVVREAAARGIAVIASDVGGLPEYVPTSCRALLFPPGDVPALVERMRLFVDDPKQFTVDTTAIPDWDAHTARLLEVYRDVARASAAAP